MTYFISEVRFEWSSDHTAYPSHKSNYVTCTTGLMVRDTFWHSSRVQKGYSCVGLVMHKMITLIVNHIYSLHFISDFVQNTIIGLFIQQTPIYNYIIISFRNKIFKWNIICLELRSVVCVIRWYVLLHSTLVMNKFYQIFIIQIFALDIVSYASLFPNWLAIDKLVMPI